MISIHILSALRNTLQNNLHQSKMSSYIVVLVAFSLHYSCCKATSICQQETAVTFLDAAGDMIDKAKSNIPALITRGASDCSELLQRGFNNSGVYTIWPASRMTEDKSLHVYCDLQKNGGGWTLIQRRGNFQREKDFFYKDWKSYKEGFGDIDKDFWLGNDNIFALTNQKLYTVRFDLKDVDNHSRYAQYDTFWIDDENNKYKLHIADYSGDAGDSMISSHNNQKFSTKDQDNDNDKYKSCAQRHKGGWWYNSCHHSNLNGLNLRGKHSSDADGINWIAWKGYYESMESSEIKIRPKNFRLNRDSLDIPM